MNKVKLILQIAKIKYKSCTVYKTSNINGIIVNSFWMMIQIHVLSAFISNGISSLTVEQGMGYVILTEAMLMITGVSGSLGGIDIDDLIKSGNIIFYFTNPVGFVGYLFGMEMGRMLYYLIWRFLPLLIIGIFLFKWYPNVYIEKMICFTISILIGLIIANEIQFIIVMIAIRNNTSMGIMDLVMAIELFFSGGLLPLSLFPDWLYKLSVYLPFSAQIYLPVTIILETEGNISNKIIVEVTWACILFVFSYWIYLLERKKIYVQGG